MKNGNTETLIAGLKRLAIEQQRPLWKRVATELEKPSRNRRVVNLWKIDKFAKDGELLLVPGKVLGDGVLTKKVTIAAAQFSDEARHKLVASGSTVLSLEEAAKHHADGKNIRILG